MDTSDRTNSPGALDAVVQSFEAGWRHMVHLMFTGPDASANSWVRWGLVLVLAAATGTSGPNFSNAWRGDHDDLVRGDFHSLREAFDWFAPYLVLALITAAALLILIVVCMWVVSRFRVVLLENVIEGRPAITGVFGKTAGAGNSYFFYQLATTASAFILILGAVALLWGPFIVSLIQGHDPSVGPVLARLLFTGLLVVPVAIFFAVLDWFVYDLVLLYLLRDQAGFLPALSEAWRITRARFGAVFLFLIARFLVAIAGGIAMFLAGCLSCVIWGLPVAMIVGLVMVSVTAPILLFVTLPITLVLLFVVAWIFSTVTAPVPVFYRAWSWKFVSMLDPSFDSSDAEPDNVA